uniref:Polyprenyl transferase atnF n=1 Tax=Arthrinium sp. TaxID=1756131 RepID=ATNF_ARTSZ|nr:RecName: Full=Polyprenyl transferase atnF; AltName: Full=Arthripenoid biosynthesis cluster protein F [Arthrinium sp.]AYO60879.1 UbiA-like polyprenyl transferase AtnF [Arthrinium sp.]
MARKVEKENGSGPIKSNHDLVRGVWQLFRLHTIEGLSTASIGWLALFFYATQQQLAFDLVRNAFIGIFATYQMTHCVFCLWNDICDRDFDGKVARTRDRPLPSGMVTLTEAMWVFVLGVFASMGVTYWLLGADVTLTMVPIWVLSFIYPLCKRIIWAPQVVLGLTMALCVLPPWVAVRKNSGSAGLLPASLFGAIFCWLVYLDLIYASQDRPDDQKAGVKSLAIFLGDYLKAGLTVLGVLQVVCFVLAASEASAGFLLWVFGIAVWSASVPWSIMSLDTRDRKSGGRIFLVNAILGIYMAAVSGLNVSLAMW